MHNALYENYYHIGRIDRYLVHMQSQTKSSGIKLLEDHGVKIPWIQMHYPKNTENNPSNKKEYWN